MPRSTASRSSATARRSRRTRWTPTSCISPTRRRAGRYLDRARRRHVEVDRFPGKRAGHPDLHRADLPQGRHRRHRRQGHDPGRGAHRAEPRRRDQRHRPPRHRREPLCRHEVPWLLRDPRRHHHAQGPPRHRVDHPGPRSGPPERRADAQVRQPDLHRLLVEPGAPDAAADDRRLAGQRERRSAPEAVQGQRRGGGPQVRRLAVRRQHRDLEEDGGAYNQADAAGFIKLNALRMRIAANKGRTLS